MEKIGMKKEKTTSNSFPLLVISPVIRGNYYANDQCYTEENEKVQKMRLYLEKFAKFSPHHQLPIRDVYQ